MAVVANVSTPTNGTVAVFNFLTAVLGNGYIIKRWSDGLTSTNIPGVLTNGLSPDNVDLTSNPYTSTATSIARSLGNQNAWFRLAAADGSREWLFQRGLAGNDQNWFISRSKAGFTGTAIGTISATVTGSATDATALFGTVAANGSNAANTATQAFPTSASWRLFVSTENATPYGFTMFGIVIGGGNTVHYLVDEPLDTATTDPADTDPYIWWGYNGSLAPPGIGPGIGTILKRFTGNSSNQSVTPLTYNIGGGFNVPGNTLLGVMPYTQREVILPVFCARPGVSSSTTGWVGTFTRMRWSTVTRTNGQTMGPVNGTYYIYMSGAWVPWDSTRPSLS